MENIALQLLEKIISFQSVTSNKAESTRLIDFIEQYLSKTNLVIRKFVSNDFPSILIHSKNYDVRKPFRFLLNAHVDVVPAPDSMFNMVTRDEKVFGRGVYDMKGAAAVMIELFKHLGTNNKLPGDVGLTIVTDEEIGGFDGTQFLLKKGVATTKFFLGGEPTDLHILAIHKGAMKVVVTYKGKSAHASTPWEGKNAIVDMAHAISFFYQKNPLPKKEVWETTYCLNLINGGTAANVIPNEIKGTFDIRRIEEDSPEKIISTIKKYFPKAEIRVTMNESGLNTKTDIFEVQRLTKIAEKYTGGKISIIKKNYATDARFYCEKGIPAVHFGLKGGSMHQDSEWIDIKSLNVYYKILKDFLLY